MSSKLLSDSEKRVLVNQYIVDAGIRRNDVKKLRSVLVEVGVRCLKSDEAIQKSLTMICKRVGKQIRKRDSTLQRVDDHLYKLHAHGSGTKSTAATNSAMQHFNHSLKGIDGMGASSSTPVTALGGQSNAMFPPGEELASSLRTKSQRGRGVGAGRMRDGAVEDPLSLTQGGGKGGGGKQAHFQFEEDTDEGHDNLACTTNSIKSASNRQGSSSPRVGGYQQKPTSFMRRSPPRLFRSTSPAAWSPKRGGPISTTQLASSTQKGPPQGFAGASTSGAEYTATITSLNSSSANSQYHRHHASSAEEEDQTDSTTISNNNKDGSDSQEEGGGHVSTLLSGGVEEEGGDSAPDRLLSLSEFVGFIAVLKAEHFNINNQTDGDLIEAFVSVGGKEDASGDVSADLLRARFKDVNLAVDIDKLIEEIDEDGSGKVEFDEFTALMTNAQMAASAVLDTPPPSSALHHHQQQQQAANNTSVGRPSPRTAAGGVVTPHPPPPSILPDHVAAVSEEEILAASASGLSSSQIHLQKSKKSREVLDPFCLFKRLGGDPDVEEMSVISRRAIIARLKDVGLNEYELRNFTYFAERVSSDFVDFSTFCSDIVDMVDYGYQRIVPPPVLTPHQRRALAIANNTTGSTRRRSAPLRGGADGGGGNGSTSAAALCGGPNGLFLMTSTSTPVPSDVERGVDLLDALAVLEGSFLPTSPHKKQQKSGDSGGGKQKQQKYVYKYGCTFPRPLGHLLHLNYSSLIWFENRAKANKRNMSFTALHILGIISSAIRLLAKHRASCPACYATNTKATVSKRDPASSTLHDLPPHYMTHLAHRRALVEGSRHNNSEHQHHPSSPSSSSPWKGGGKRGLLAVRDSFGLHPGGGGGPVYIGGVALPRIDDANDSGNCNPHKASHGVTATAADHPRNAAPVNALTKRATPRYAPEPDLDVLALRIFDRNRRASEQDKKYEEKFGRPPPNTSRTSKHYFTHVHHQSSPRLGTAESAPRVAATTMTATRANGTPWVPFPPKPSSARQPTRRSGGGRVSANETSPPSPPEGIRAGSTANSHRRRNNKESFSRAEDELEDVSQYYWTRGEGSKGGGGGGGGGGVRVGNITTTTTFNYSSTSSPTAAVAAGGDGNQSQRNAAGLPPLSRSRHHYGVRK